MSDLEEKAKVAPLKRLSGNQLDLNVNFVIDVEHRMIIVKFSKKLRAADIEQYAQRLVSNPFFDPSFSEIVDLTEVEEVELRGDDLLRLADHIDPFSFDSKRAFVVKDAKQSHQARMYQISRLSKDNIRAVRSIDEAKRWIVGGVPPRD